MTVNWEAGVKVYLKNAIFCFTLALCSVGANANEKSFSDCREHFPHEGVPVIRVAYQELRDLCFDAFAIMHSGQSKTPLYVVERLNRSNLLRAERQSRKDKFYEEGRLPFKHRSQLEDYKSSLVVDGVAYRFDRGHMAPAANMYDGRSMAQS